MVGAAISALALIAIGIASIVARGAVFGLGVGIMLIVYGLLVGAGAWLGWARSGLARGVIVAPALLHLATAISLAGGGDLPQLIGGVVAAAFFAVIIVAAVLPSTREVLGKR